MLNTTEERVQFVRNRIAEYKATAQDCRAKAIGATVTDAANYLKMAELAEAMAASSERTLLVLFP